MNAAAHGSLVRIGRHREKYKKLFAFFFFCSAVMVKADRQMDEGRVSTEGRRGIKVGGRLQANFHTSSSMILKSSVSERQQLLKVWQGLLRPRYKFSSTHSPKWPLQGR